LFKIGVVCGLSESKQIAYKAIFTEAKKLEESLKQVRKELLDVCNHTYPQFKNIHRLKGLLEDYNRLSSNLRSLEELSSFYNLLPEATTNFLYQESFKSKILKSPLYAQDIDMAISEVERAERGCHVITSICEDLMKPNIPPASIDRLNQLINEVEKIEKNLPAEEIVTADNLRTAIKEYEQGHFLASALVASRVIRYVYEKIPSEGTSKDQSQQKLQTLIKIGMIEKDREDEQRFFLRAAVRARDYLSHNVKIFPQVEEALFLIGAAVTFCKYFITLSRS
jgi:hypothetical protein